MAYPINTTSTSLSFQQQPCLGSDYVTIPSLLSKLGWQSEDSDLPIPGLTLTTIPCLFMFEPGGFFKLYAAFCTSIHPKSMVVAPNSSTRQTITTLYSVSKQNIFLIAPLDKSHFPEESSHNTKYAGMLYMCMVQ